MATSSLIKIPTSSHHSSGPKKELSLTEIQAFCGRINGEGQKKKGLRHEMRIISAVYWCISILEKEKKVAGQMIIKVAGRVKCLGGQIRAVGRRLPTLALTRDLILLFIFLLVSYEYVLSSVNIRHTFV